MNKSDLVYEYYKNYAHDVTSAIDCYLVTFFPVAVGKPLNYVLKTSSLSAKLIADQNPIFDPDHNSQVTVAEVLNHFQNLYSSVWPLISAGATAQYLKNTITVEKIVRYFILPLAVFFYSIVSLNA
ncbi:hypothetical protein [Flavobacterium sp. 3HN19-14]|uniref:hypothetical protein n=1 Tax=Flavobacterium sp. 3HN19-14 TaxID=3448133 RepID=UPI003EE012C8